MSESKKPMTKASALRDGYFTGVMMALALSLLVQDYLGKDGYLALVQNNWINLPWWPWLLVLAWLSMVLFRKLREARKP